MTIDVAIGKAQAHLGHRIGVAEFANGSNLAICCEDCQEVLGDAEVASCDLCSQTKHVDDMFDLGGDRYLSGYAPEAFPAVCQDCQDNWRKK